MDGSSVSAYPDDVDIAMLWRAVGRNKGRLLATVLLAGLAAYAIMLLMIPRYTSSAVVLVERDESSYTRPREERQQAPDSTRIDDSEMESQVQVVMSRDQLQRVTKQLDLAKIPEFNLAIDRNGPLSSIIGMLSLGGGGGRQISEEERVLSAFIDRLTVYSVTKSHAIRIDFTSEHPELAAKAANAVARAYLEFNTAGQLRQDAEASTWLGSQIDDLRQSAEKAEAELERFRAQAGLLSGQNNVTLSAQQLSEINTQLSQARSQRTDAESRAKLIREMLANGDIDASPDVLKSAIVQRLMDQKAQVQRQVAELSATLLPGHPRMRQLYSELKDVNANIRTEALKVVRSLDNEVQVAATRQRVLETTLAELSSKMEHSSGAQAKLGVLAREAQSRRAVYETYLDRLNDASTRRGRPIGGAFARLLSTAAPTSIPVFPKKVPFTLLVMMATLLGGLTWIISREMIFASRGGYRMPMPSAPTPSPLPPLPNAPVPSGDAFRMPPKSVHKPVRLGSVSAVSQHLAMRAQSIPGFRTLVTGETAGVSVAEEALSIARKLTSADRKVVLIDWSDDGAGAGELIGAPRGPGLADLVASKATFEDILHLDTKSAVHVVRAGQGQAALGDAAFEQQLSLVLDALDEIYHHVVVSGERVTARRAFETMQGRFDAGVVVRPDGANQNPSEDSRFLGFDVANLEVIWLERPAAARRSPVRSTLSPGQRANA